jgi:hypothetical protein
MSHEQLNKLILFYDKWDENQAKLWLKKIFDTYDKNGDGHLERSEINDWRQKTTHPKDFRPLTDDKEWADYLFTSFGIKLEKPMITLEQLFEIQKIVDAKAQYLGGNTLFTDIWHMLDLGIINDPQLVPHVVLRSKCRICGEAKKMIDFRGITHDARGDGQWSKSDNERVCIDCEEESAYKTVTRFFDLNGVKFKFRFSFVRDAMTAHEVTKLFVDDEVVGGIDFREEGPHFLAKAYFKGKKGKTTSLFALKDPEPVVEDVPEVQKAAFEYYSQLAARSKVSVTQLTLILGDMFLFPNPDQVADIFGLTSA